MKDNMSPKWTQSIPMDSNILHGLRLDSKSLLPIAAHFFDKIKLIDWDEWGSPKKGFMPFESLSNIITGEGYGEISNAALWMLKHHPTHSGSIENFSSTLYMYKTSKDSLLLPENSIYARHNTLIKSTRYYYDVIWMPSIIPIQEDSAIILYDSELSTTWSPKIVAKQYDYYPSITTHSLLVWDSEHESWFKFFLIPDNLPYSSNRLKLPYTVNYAFMTLLNGWLQLYLTSRN